MKIEHPIGPSLVIAFIAFISLSGETRGAVMLGISSASSADSTDWGSLDHLIDQSGLSASYTPGVTDFTSFTSATTHLDSTASISWGTNQGSFGASTSVLFDLGVAQTVTEFAFWGDDGTNTNNIGSFTIDISNDPTFSTFTSLGGGTGPGSNNNPVDAAVFDITDGTGRYVRLNANSYGGPWVLIGEVAFGGGTGVPEPSVGLLSGLAALGLLRRRR